MVAGFTGLCSGEWPAVARVTDVVPEHLGVHSGLGSVLWWAGRPLGIGVHSFAFPAQVAKLERPIFGLKKAKPPMLAF